MLWICRFDLYESGNGFFKRMDLFMVSLPPISPPPLTGSGLCNL